MDSPTLDNDEQLRARAERIVTTLHTGAFEPSLVEEKEPLSAWHEAAAVLSTFQMSELLPMRPTPAPKATMLADCIQTAGTSPRRWTLLPEFRVRALTQLGTRKRMLQALSANAQRPTDALQVMLETIIRGADIRIERLSIAELEAAVQAIEWFDTLIDDLPAKQAVLDRLDYLRLLEPFEHLVGAHFYDRAAELNALSDYAGAGSTATAGKAILPGLRRAKSSHMRPPLAIVAAGDAGKSTLIAKFILDHAHAAKHERIPFAYLDFDRPTISAEEPISVLIEAMRQIGIQYPHRRADCEEMRRKWRTEVAISATTQSDTASRSPNTLARFVGEFAQLTRSLLTGNNVLLLVLDTLEEAEYRSGQRLPRLWQLMRMVQWQLPSVRCILSGRAPISGIRHEQLDLLEFDEATARGFLEALGISPAFATTVVRRVGGSPLSLRLAAADLLNEESAEGVRDPDAPGLAPRVERALIRGLLFERLVDHIHDDDVRRLAYPSLALRRITPELIELVLAQPCGVDVKSAAHARELFNDLSRETSLVQPAADGALIHLGDVRRRVLPLLAISDPERIRTIEEGAVHYYETQPQLAARAEEIYHRLRLGEGSDVIRERWLKGIEPFLGSALDELTPGGRLLLAGHGVGPARDKAIIREASHQRNERAASIETKGAPPSRQTQDDIRFRELYNRYYRAVAAYLVHYGFSREDSLDLAQDVFVRIYKHQREYQGVAEWAFLKTTTLNVALSHLRRQRAAHRDIPFRDLLTGDAPVSAEDDLVLREEERGVPFRDPFTGESPASAEDDLVQREESAFRRRVLRDAITELPDGTRKALMLWLSGCKYREIEETLGITIDAVKSRLHEARIRLRSVLAEENEGIEWPGDDDDQER